MDSVMRALPYIAMGIGALIILLALRNAWKTNRAPLASAGQVGSNMAPNYALGADASTQYGTQTMSGIPFYDQYQDKYAAPQVALAPGFTQDGAISPAPVCSDAKTCNQSNEMCAQNPAACGGVTTGNMNMADYNADPQATCPSVAGNVRKLYGCLDTKSTTWNPHANTHDQRFCQYPTVISGCTNRGAVNYNQNATVNDGSCVTARVGCMDTMAANFDALANVPCEGCCVPSVGGCTNPNAPNYQMHATIDDGSCIMTSARVMPVVAVEAPMCGNMMTAPFSSDCAPPMDNPWLGNLKSCGTPWDQNMGNRNPLLY